MKHRAGSALAVCVLLVLAGCLGTVSVGEQEAPTATPAQATQATPTDGELSVQFLNVGQGHSVLVVGPTGETMLVDTGHWEDGGRHVIAALERQGIDRIDYLVTSHADADHIGGHAEVIEHFETQGEGVGAIYDPGIAASSRTYEDYLDAVERYEIPLYKTLAGDSIPLAAAEVDVLAPPDGYLANDDRNENSLVLHVRFGNVSFLLPGDAEQRAERYLLEFAESELSATVLQAGHHGSSSSSGPAFLDQVNPRVTVISSAYDSQYGHPHEEVLERLAARNVRTYWTAVHGTVVATTDGQNLTMRTQRDATTDPQSLYSARPIDPGSSVPVQPRIELSGEQLGTIQQATPSAEATTIPDGGTEQPPEATERADDGPLQIAEVHADAGGDDHDNLNEEYVVFENAGEADLDLSGWTVTDEADHAYSFPPGTTLEPGETVALYTGQGTDGDGRLYWGSNAAVWNNGGDTIRVHDADGTLVLEVSYP